MSDRPLRIAIAGFQHETNSFALHGTDLSAFEMADSWPGLLARDAVVTGTLGLNLPIAGFASAAEAAGDVALLPLLWCAAEPAGPVADAAFDDITNRITRGLADAAPLDGLYLDLHGAMITDRFPDGEAEILRRIRHEVGPDLPIAVSLDMHANLSARTVEMADVLCIFRTYPHLDMAETGARCLAPLRDLISGHSLAKAFRQVPYLIPLHTQYTGDGPVADFYQAAATIGQQHGAHVEFAVGFSSGDTPETGPAVVAFAPLQDQAEAAADAMLAHALALESAFDCALPDPATAVRLAKAQPPSKPCVLADVQDNPGGGASSDTTGLLRALVAEGAEAALLGVMHDPDAAALAHKAGVGALIDAALGGRSGHPEDKPFHGQFRVDALSDGIVPYEGEMYGGGIARIGPTAVLRPVSPQADLQIVVSSVRNQCLDPAYFRHIGLHPETAHIVAVKSTVHYRAAFDPMAHRTIPLASPGALRAHLPDNPYENLRPGIRLGPCGPAWVSRQNGR